jgi:glycosyltransferase involved in cell wall biosynthesis
MKVVMSAYACRPGGTSERGLGWAWACAAAERHEVWLVTREQARPEIEAELQVRPRPGLHPVYVDTPSWTRRWKSGRRGLYPYSCIWQLLVWRTVSRMHQEIGFDVGHHITFAIDWLPAGVAYVRDLPTIWGPVGPGLNRFPASMWRAYGLRWLFQESVRAVVSTAGHAFLGQPTAKRAAVVVAQNGDVAKVFAAHPHLVVEQNSVCDEGARPMTAPQAGKRAVFVGRLVPWKGVRVAIATMADPRAEEWSLDIFGTGPEEQRAIEYARRLGVASRVCFRGVVSQEEIYLALGTADALLHPSTRDNAPGAVAEAVSVGCPVVCLDSAGPGTMVGEDEGTRIPPSADPVAAFAHALGAVRGRHAGSRRWSSARLPDLLDEWYVSVRSDRVPA